MDKYIELLDKISQQLDMHTTMWEELLINTKSHNSRQIELLIDMSIKLADISDCLDGLSNDLYNMRYNR